MIYKGVPINAGVPNFPGNWGRGVPNFMRSPILRDTGTGWTLLKFETLIIISSSLLRGGGGGWGGGVGVDGWVGGSIELARWIRPCFPQPEKR